MRARALAERLNAPLQADGPESRRLAKLGALPHPTGLATPVRRITPPLSTSGSVMTLKRTADTSRKADWASPLSWIIPCSRAAPLVALCWMTAAMISSLLPK